jgi:hypothetical protein
LEGEENRLQSRQVDGRNIKRRKQRTRLRQE